MSKTTKLLLVFLFFTIISSISLLFSGIKIDSFSFGNFSVSQFYIKLNKKLIVDVEKIIYKSKKSEVSSSFEDLKKDIELLPNILSFFERIDIERLIIDGNEVTFQLDNESIYFDSKFVNLSAKVDFLSNQVVFDLYSLYLKDVNLLFDGKIKLDYFNDKLDYFGAFLKDDLSGDVKISATKDLMMVYLNSKPFKSLKFLKQYVRLPSIAESWMYDNVQGNIRLKEFYGGFDLKNNKLLMNTLQGRAIIDNGKVKFHKNVTAIDTKKIEVDFAKDTLTFNLVEPKYKNIPMTGSNVVIRNLTSANDGEVEVNIKAKAKLNEDVHQILRAYKINIPLVQKTGTTNANLKLIFPYSLSKKMTTLGEFDIKNSKIAINKFEFDSKSAKVLLNGTKIDIQNAYFKHKSLIDSVVNLNLDTKTLKANGNANINSFYVGNNQQEILNIRKYKMPISLDFNKNVHISLNKLTTNISIGDLIYVDISDLSVLYPYSKILKENSIKKGSLKLDIKDENDLVFTGNIGGLDFPIEKDAKKITSMEIIGKIKNNNFNIKSKYGLIEIEKIDNNPIHVSLKNLDVNLKNNSTNDDSKLPRMDVNLINSKLMLKDDTYYLGSMNANISSSIINFDGVVNNLDLPLIKSGKKIDSLDIKGSYSKDKTEVYTKSNDLNLILQKDDISIDLNGYDIVYNTEDSNDNNNYKNFNLTAKNSNIIMNDKYKFLSDALEIRLTEERRFLHLNYKSSNITFKESKEKVIDIFANDISSEFLNSIFGKKIIDGGKYMLLAKGMIDNLDGKLIIENSKIEDLAVLNNLLLFIHTSPALINPLLAIPSVIGMASKDGFNLTGYKIVNGNIDFNYSKEKEQLKIKKLLTVGNGIDFDGTGNINLKDMTLKSKIKLIFLKDYSSIVGAIPIVNYVLLGDNKRVETAVDVFGPLNNPKISTNLTKETFSVPVNIAKRLLQSPGKLLEFISGKKEEENKPKQ